MSYALVDEALLAWAKARQLHLYTTHRDEAVRSTNVVGMDGSKCQIWIDAPGPDGVVHVHVWDYRARRRDFEGPVGETRRFLDEAWSTAIGWLNTAGEVED